MIRPTANVFNTTSCKPYFNELKFMALPYIYIYKIPIHINMSLNRFKTKSLIHSYSTRNKYDVFVTGHNTKLFKQFYQQWCAHFKQTIQWNYKHWACDEFQENLIQFSDQKEFLFSGRIYDNGLSTSKSWMNKDKLRLDVSWLWFVVWLCFTCCIMTNQCLMYPSNYFMCQTCVGFVSNLMTWGICYLSLVFSYSVHAYISGIVNFITCLLCNIITFVMINTTRYTTNTNNSLPIWERCTAIE